MSVRVPFTPGNLREIVKKCGCPAAVPRRSLPETCKRKAPCQGGMGQLCTRFTDCPPALLRLVKTFRQSGLPASMLRHRKRRRCLRFSDTARRAVDSKVKSGRHIGKRRADGECVAPNAGPGGGIDRDLQRQCEGGSLSLSSDERNWPDKRIEGVISSICLMSLQKA